MTELLIPGIPLVVLLAWMFTRPELIPHGYRPIQTPEEPAVPTAQVYSLRQTHKPLRMRR